VSPRQDCKEKKCALLVTKDDGSADFHIQGFVYAPNARMELYLGGIAGSAFHWGLMLGSFQVGIKGTSPTNPFVELPPNSVGASTSYSVMYLSVWVCPAGASPCNSGPARLTAKVQVTGSPAAVTVLSWSVKR
jgi:hypothetical protein